MPFRRRTPSPRPAKYDTWASSVNSLDIAGTENVFTDPLSLIEALETSIDVQALVAAQQQAEELERFRTGSTGLQLQLVRILGCNVLVLCTVYPIQALKPP